MVRVHAYILNYNESRLMPFVMDHLSSYCAEIYLYDNASTDSSLEIARRYERVTIRPYDGKGFDDMLHLEMKNTIWKASRGKADWVVVSDLDEFLYHKDILGRLRLLKENGCTVVRPNGYDMVMTEWPVEGISIFKQGDKGVRNANYDKCICFDPNKIEDMKYCVGAHSADPVGDVCIYDWSDFLLLHYKYVTLKKQLKWAEETYKRINKDNLAKGYGVECTWSKVEITAAFYARVAMAVKLDL